MVGYRGVSGRMLFVSALMEKRCWFRRPSMRGVNPSLRSTDTEFQEKRVYGRAVRNINI